MPRGERPREITDTAHLHPARAAEPGAEGSDGRVGNLMGVNSLVMIGRFVML